MISHITLGISDLERARAFYAALLEPLGWTQLTQSPDEGWAGFQPSNISGPMLSIALPVDGAAMSIGNGSMIAFKATVCVHNTTLISTEPTFAILTATSFVFAAINLNRQH